MTTQSQPDGGFDPLTGGALTPPEGGYATYKFTYRHHYIEVPVRVNYAFVNKSKFSLYGIAGVSTGIFIGGNAEGTASGAFSYEGERELNKNLYKTVTFSALVGVGASYQLCDRFSLHAEPLARLPLTRSNIEAPIASYLYNIGLNAGVSYRF